MPRQLPAIHPSSAIESELIRASSEAAQPSRRSPRRDRSTELVRREFTLPRELDDYFSHELLRAISSETPGHVSRSELLRATLKALREMGPFAVSSIAKHLGDT